MNTLEEKYAQNFYKYLDNIIDFHKYDEKINNSGLYFGKSNDVKHNILSDFLSILNNFYVEKLSEEDKEKLNINDIEVIKKTYIDILKKGNDKMIMYNPPMPEHAVKNGTLVLEFVYGKNTSIIPEEQYSLLIRKQKEFIKNISEEIKNEIKEKLGLNCEIFINKRIRKYE